MRKPDRYSNYAHLIEEENEGTDFIIHSLDRSQSGIIVIAPHDGKIEPGTHIIAKKIAQNDFSLYTFNGIKVSSNLDLHITSHNFDEPKRNRPCKITHKCGRNSRMCNWRRGCLPWGKRQVLKENHP